MTDNVQMNHPRRSIRSAVRLRLSRPALPIMLAALAVLLTLPSLWGGWVMDDHAHRLRMAGSPRFEELFKPASEMFTFWDGD